MNSKCDAASILGFSWKPNGLHAGGFKDLFDCFGELKAANGMEKAAFGNFYVKGHARKALPIYSVGFILASLPLACLGSLTGCQLIGVGLSNRNPLRVMESGILKILVLGSICAGICPMQASEEEPRITLHSFTGGGGDSINGNGTYRLRGELNQGWGRESSGADYRLVGGFVWETAHTAHLVPSVLIVRRDSENHLEISWPQGATAWVLEEASALGGRENPIWSEVQIERRQQDGEVFVRLPLEANRRFYRLRMP